MNDTYRLDFTVKGLPEDEIEYETAVEKIRQAINNAGYECDFGIGISE